MPDAFERRVDVYDAMIDWGKRLAHEEPFYRSLCKGLSARSAVDVACGTGRHAAMLHSWGLEVEGADVSPTMLERARALHGSPAGLRWVERRFDQPMGEPGRFDLAICVGNSLPLVEDPAAMRTTVKCLLEAVRPGGAVVVQVLNLWRLPEAIPQWQKCVYVEVAGERRLVIKGVHRAGGRGYVDLLIADTHAPSLSSDCPSFAGIEADELRQWMAEGGADRVDCLGGYVDQPYDREKSTDLLMVGYRAK